MKLHEIALDKIEEIKNLIRKSIPMSLLGPENCLITIHPEVVYDGENRDESIMRLKLYVDLFLDDDMKLRKEMFQEIADGTIHHLKQRGFFNIQRSDECEIIIQQIDLYKDKLRLPLFKYIHEPNKLQFQTPKQIKELIDGTDKYEIGDDVLPTIELDYNEQYKHIETKANNVYKFLRKGKFNGDPYVLPEDYKLNIVYNPNKFNFTEKIIKPHFDVYIKISGEDMSPEDPDHNLYTFLHNKFEKFDVILQYY